MLYLETLKNVSCHACNCSFSDRNDVVDVDLCTVEISHCCANDGTILCLVVDHGVVEEDAHYRTPATTNISTNRFQLTSKGEFLLVSSCWGGWMGISVQIGSSLQAKVSSCWWGVDGNFSTNRFQLTSKGEFLLVGGGWEYQYK